MDLSGDGCPVEIIADAAIALAVDWIHDLLFFVNPDLGYLKVSNLEGEYITTVVSFTENGSYVVDIAVHPGTRYINKIYKIHKSRYISQLKCNTEIKHSFVVVCYFSRNKCYLKCC